jgi:glycosyltransferase involved in cell wall biosynthesis
VAIEETKYLQGLGHDSHLISLIKPVNPWYKLLDGLPVEYLADYKAPTPFLSELLNRNLVCMKRISKNYDAVICHNLPSCYVIHRDRSSKIRKMISYIHDPIHFTLTGNIFQILFKISSFKRSSALKWLGGSDAILVNSLKSKKTLKSATGLDSEVLYPTIASFKDELPRERQKFFLCVGRIGAHPAFTDMLRILDRIPQMELVIAGSWSHTAKGIVDMFSSKQQLKDRVRIVINPSDKELRDLYRNARAFLYPGIENFNMSALEAASNGCPIIVPNESGICEVMQDHALCAAYGDVDSFVRIVKSLLDDHEKALHEGRKSFQSLKGFNTAYHMSKLKTYLHIQ